MHAFDLTHTMVMTSPSWRRWEHLEGGEVNNLGVMTRKLKFPIDVAPPHPHTHIHLNRNAVWIAIWTPREISYHFKIDAIRKKLGQRYRADLWARNSWKMHMRVWSGYRSCVAWHLGSRRRIESTARHRRAQFKNSSQALGAWFDMRLDTYG